jgi:hypothetical protein
MEKYARKSITVGTMLQAGYEMSVKQSKKKKTPILLFEKNGLQIPIVQAKTMVGEVDDNTYIHELVDSDTGEEYVVYSNNSGQMWEDVD